MYEKDDQIDVAIPFVGTQIAGEGSEVTVAMISPVVPFTVLFI